MEPITVERDDWGIAHVHGATDADAVFGMIYAQAEDNFAQIENNYLAALGRLAEADGESAIWQDLRARMFLDPDRLRRDYAASPASLRTLMDAWADGLDQLLADHPAVKPRVLVRFEPWMALAFAEGSIGADLEGISVDKLAAFYGEKHASQVEPADPTGSNGIAIAPRNTREEAVRREGEQLRRDRRARPTRARSRDHGWITSCRTSPTTGSGRCRSRGGCASACSATRRWSRRC